MWTPLRDRSIRPLRLATCVLAVVCSKPTSHVDAPAQQSGMSNAAASVCARDSIRPSAAPPAQGMWTSDELPGSARVAAMIGPADVRTGSTVVTRTIETVEDASSVNPLRARVDDAVVRLELVPRYLSADGSRRRSPRGDETEPAAVYALTPLVSLASYEFCGGPPAVRYLRRNAAGRVERDAMLHWVSALK